VRSRLINSMFSEILKKEREAKRYSLEELNKQTGVPVKFISALEKADFSSLPAPVYIRGYLKKLSKTLDLNYEELWELSLKEYEELKAPAVDTLPQNRFEHPLKLRHVFLKIAKFLPIILVAGATIGFLFLQVHSLVGSPYLKLEKPPFDLNTEDSSMVVEGYGRANSYIQINGKEVYLGKDGKFSEEIYLNQGLNEIKVEAESRLGKTATIIRRIIKE